MVGGFSLYSRRFISADGTGKNFGVTTVIPSEWNNVKQVTKKDFPCSFKIIAEIDNWVQVCFETEECFTICGI